MPLALQLLDSKGSVIEMIKTKIFHRFAQDGFLEVYNAYFITDFFILFYLR